MLSPAALLARLKRRLPLLTDGPHDQPDRLRTMQAGIAWSHDLLSPKEQRLFRRLAVFAGGFTLEAAESVTDDVAGALDSVSDLVDKSLVHREVSTTAEARFAMLETIREYAMEQLAASDETVDAYRAHAGYFTGLAEQAESSLRGPSQQQWRDTLEVGAGRPPRRTGLDLGRVVRSERRGDRPSAGGGAVVLLVPAGTDRGSASLVDPCARHRAEPREGARAGAPGGRHLGVASGRLRHCARPPRRERPRVA